MKASKSDKKKLPEKRKVGRPKKLTDDQIAEAIEKNMGFIAHTAKQLGLSARMVHYRIERSAELREKIDHIREVKLDFAENALEKKIKEGNLTAIIFYLKCMGSKRGWIDQGTVAEKNDEKPAVFNINFASPKEQIKKELQNEKID